MKIEYTNENSKNSIRTYYSYDAQGNVMATYKRTILANFAGSGANSDYTDEFVLSEQMVYGSSRIGMEQKNRVITTGEVNETTGTINFELGEGVSWDLVTQESYDLTFRKLEDKVYELTEHRGNVMEVITDRKLPVDDGVFDVNGNLTSTTQDGVVDYYAVNVVTYTDYAPYGVVLDGRNGGESYRYSFQNQESDPEIKGEGNSINYKYRMHDPRIGRFFAIDPLAAKYPWYTPYQFSGNKVIAFRELEGLEEYPVNIGEGGVTKTVDNTVDNEIRTFTADYKDGSSRTWNWMYNGGDPIWQEQVSAGLETAPLGSLGPVAHVEESEKLVKSPVGGYLNNPYNQNSKYGMKKSSLWPLEGISSSDAGNALAPISYTLGSLGRSWAKALDRNFSGNRSISLLKTPKFIPNIRVPTGLLKSAPYLKGAGSALGALGLAITFDQWYSGQISGLEAGVDGFFGVISFFPPVGTIMGLVYFGGKAIYEYSTGESLFEKPNNTPVVNPNKSIMHQNTPMMNPNPTGLNPRTNGVPNMSRPNLGPTFSL